MFVLNICTVGSLRTKNTPSLLKRELAQHGMVTEMTEQQSVVSGEMEDFKRRNIKVPPGLSKSIFFFENCNYSTVQAFFLNVCRGFWGFFFPSPSWQHLPLTTDRQSLHLPSNVNEKLTRYIFALYSSSGLEQRNLQPAESSRTSQWLCNLLLH